MNNFNGIGRICNDLTLEKAGEISVVGVNFALKTSRKDDKGEYRTAFLHCKAFGRTAENIAKHFKKGDAIGISAQITDESYIKQDGTKVSKIGFIINGFDFITGKKQDAPTANSSFDDEDIPF